MSSHDRDSSVDAPFDAIQGHYGCFHGIKDVGEAFQLAPKVNKRFRYGALAVRPLKRDVLGERRQDEMPLHQREVVADADVRATAKGQVGVAR